jgi:hypothetical protein
MRLPVVAAVSLLVLAPGALADGRVPEVLPEALPVAGTCAPMPGADATVVTVGEPGWYRVSGRQGEVDDEALKAVFAERSGAARDGTGASRHSVWIVTRGDVAFRPAIGVLLAAQKAGIFRVGLQVRCESNEGVMGFPLFLAAPSSAAPGGGTAKRLEVKVEADAKVPSDPRLLYEATRRATEKFGTVVAEVSIHGAVKTQDAVSSLDMLWRGGVAGVRIAWRGLPPRWQGLPGLKLLVQGREVGSDGSSVELPGIRARKQPWPDDGAAQPGALSLVLDDLPGGEAGEGAESRAPKPLPNYARLPEGPPAAVRREAETKLLGWARAVAKDLADATRGTPLPKPGVLVVREGREEAKAAKLLAPAKDTFGTAERVVPATLHTAVYLFLGTKIVGKVDLTLHLAGDGLSVVFASWVAEAAPGDLVLPPEPVDPFAAGVAGALRVWIEGLLASGREGAVGIPLTPDREVLAQLPAVAHGGVQPRLATRSTQIENLAGWLRATTYDRVFVLPPEATYSVWARGRVEGILRVGLEPEETDLRINALSARAAPR